MQNKPLAYQPDLSGLVLYLLHSENPLIGHLTAVISSKETTSKLTNLSRRSRKLENLLENFPMT